MKPHSCLFRATAAVCEAQFGIEIAAEVFDAHNVGTGIPTTRIVPVLNAALLPYNITVGAVYCIGLEGEFEGKELVRNPEGLVPVPAIVLVNRDHAEPALPGTHMSGIMAITLKRIIA